MKKTFLLNAILLGLLSAQGSSQVSGGNCSFIAKPDDFLSRQIRARRELVGRTNQLSSLLTRTKATSVAARDLPRRNFIDDAIFGSLETAKVASAGLTTDEEFIRRITLDLTGRIPSAADIRSFEADQNAAKRDVLIERLLYSPEFVDKWTMWLGDLLQNTANASNVNPGVGARDAFYNYMRVAIDGSESFRDIAIEAVTAAGDTSDSGAGPASFIYRMTTPMGPVQDHFDTSLAKTATAFLGIAYYDCLLCHNGRGHLDQISLWGSTLTRADAQRMAAFFSRLNFPMPRTNPDVSSSMYNSWRVLDKPTGGYDLNTTFGNRPNRLPVGTLKTLTPVYRDGTAPAANQPWRDAFANSLVTDPMFARNFANRMWKAFFNLGQVDPVDTMDPARLDPNNPPPAPWSLQAANPVLFEQLSRQAVALNFQFRDFIRLLVQSTAYQLSSRYEGAWDITSVPLFARHYPRRLDAEEIHDAIAKATGVLGNYNVNGGTAPPVQWAMQLPDPTGATPAGGATNLLNAFLRGNRDTAPRSGAASILQRLTLMNDSFVTSRIKVGTSPVLASIAKLTDNDALLDELYLAFLSRIPTDDERAKGKAYLAKATTAAQRNSAVEDLAWVCINSLDFVYSY